MRYGFGKLPRTALSEPGGGFGVASPVFSFYSVENHQQPGSTRDIAVTPWAAYKESAS